MQRAPQALQLLGRHPFFASALPASHLLHSATHIPPTDQTPPADASPLPVLPSCSNSESCSSIQRYPGFSPSDSGSGLSGPGCFSSVSGSPPPCSNILTQPLAISARSKHRSLGCALYPIGSSCHGDTSRFHSGVSGFHSNVNGFRDNSNGFRGNGSAFVGCRGFSVSSLTDSGVTAGVEEVLKAEQAAELAAIAAAKAESYMTTSWFIDALDYVHTSTGWPWWVAIAVVNFAVRICTFPVIIFVQKSSVKAMALSSEMRRLKQLQEAATKAPTLKEYEVLQKRFVDESQKVMSKHGSSMKLTLLSPLLTVVNGVVFVSFFSALSNLTKEKVPSMTHEGVLWFADLTLPDPYFGLPVICCLTTLAMVELGAVQQEMMMQGNTAKMMKWVMRVLSLLFIPAGKYVASAVGIMWVSNSIVAIAQSRVLASPAMRAKLGLPELSKMREAMQGSLAQLRQGTGQGTAAQTGEAGVASAASVKPPAPGTPASAPGASATPAAMSSHKPQLYDYKPPKRKNK